MKKVIETNPHSSPGSDDQPFRHYSAKHRVVAWVSQTLFDNVTYTVRHGLLKGMKRKGGLAWMPELMSGSEITAEHQFWKNMDLRGKTVYDVGGFHGLLTMFFARQAKMVIVYEPNTKNNARLKENLQLNGIQNVQVRKVGVGSKSETLTMVITPGMPGGASVETDAIAGMRNSKTPLQSESISIVTLDEDISSMSLAVPDFIKIDIEGLELPALVGAKKTLLTHKPQLFLEMHGETMNLKRKKVAEIVACLNEYGYDDILHIESGTKLNASNAAIAAEGHLFCV